MRTNTATDGGRMGRFEIRIGWRGLAATAVVFAVCAAGLLAWARTHGFSARIKPSAVETFLARGARRLAVPTHVRNLKNPIRPGPIALADARDHFADHCATCHANDGSGRTMVNDGLFPPAADLRSREVQEKTDGELLYAIREGIRFTGMPGWGGEDEENWKLVLFIRHLPELTEEELALMKEENRERH